MRATPFVNFSCSNYFSLAANVKCTFEQGTQNFHEIHFAYGLASGVQRSCAVLPLCYEEKPQNLP